MDKKNKIKDIDRIALDNMKNTFQMGELSKSLGLTRDTLRYYEKIGLIRPKKDNINKYRKFDFFDIYSLWSIDFYKKRGLSLNEIQQVIENRDVAYLRNILEDTQKQIEQEIEKKEKLLQKIKETKNLCDTLEEECNHFSIREFPLYEIKSAFTDITSLEEYDEKVLRYLNLQEEDILSNVVRKLTFNDEGYQESIMYTVERAENDKQQKEKSYLEQGACIYTLVESGDYSDSENTIGEKTMYMALAWAKDQGVKLKGEVYLKAKLILFKDDKERVFVEAWAPIIKKL